MAMGYCRDIPPFRGNVTSSFEITEVIIIIIIIIMSRPG